MSEGESVHCVHQHVQCMLGPLLFLSSSMINPVDLGNLNFQFDYFVRIDVVTNRFSEV